MKIIEIIRHTMRDLGQPGISVQGRALAEYSGKNTVTFHKVVTSQKTRAIETAQAMGYEPDLTLSELNTLIPGVEDEVYWDSPFNDFSIAYKKEGAVFRFGNMLADIVREYADTISDEQNLLIVSHGGIVQNMAIACFPDADHTAWGGACSYCEGIRLEYSDGKFRSAVPVRRCLQAEK